MSSVILYTTPSCSYCLRAKRLLIEKGIPFEEIDIGQDPELLKRMVSESGRRTVPQVFIDGKPIGGFEELKALDEGGGLDSMLGSV